MQRTLFLLTWTIGSGLLAQAHAETIPNAHAQAEAPLVAPADSRFAADCEEVPSLQRHVLPLMGRLGCNGRACHGSFQGQGGFRLSLFGYDFKTDYEALVKSKVPRVDPKNIAASMILAKPSSDDKDEHGGGKRIEVGSWQYRLIANWIKAGAPAVDEAKDPQFVRMEVTPTEIVYDKIGAATQLHVVAHWSDGSREDVTPLCRFQTQDDAVAKVDPAGKITCVGKGDTHVVAFYDNGVVPVGVLLPVSDRSGPAYPDVAAKTRIDQLVVTKLRKLGVVPSEVCSDSEFLRRASLDITGQLPSAAEVEAFAADTAPNKRAKKTDELLARPAYAAWWSTKLNDILGNSENQLRNGAHSRASELWYRWINGRLADNAHYDDIVEGIVLATGRSSAGQTLAEYSAEMSSYVRNDSPADIHERATMPFYWMRQNMRTPNEKALSFSYAFLGVRLQCAECHKHPFDQWSQYDFQHFTAFFNRVSSGLKNKQEYEQMVAALKLEVDPKKGGGQVRQTLDKLAIDGKVVPFPEVFIQDAKNGKAPGKENKGKFVAAGRVITPKVLGGEEIVDRTYDDPRQPLMDWLRQKDNPYFAKSFVNRVWANYFNVGIVEPADDMNLANAPSNKELLDYLAAAFVEHDYDIKWLMREIVGSETYQRSWHVNATNELDLRNFSRAVPRRLPAEVVYDAVVSATAGDAELSERSGDPITTCAIGLGLGYTTRNNGGGKGRSANYALSVFGKPKRETPCDCERSNEPSLLQTVFLRNDQEMFSLITRRNGWLDLAVGSSTKPMVAEAAGSASEPMKKIGRELATLRAEQERLAGLLKETGDKKPTAEKRKKLEQEQAWNALRLAELRKARFAGEAGGKNKPGANGGASGAVVTQATTKAATPTPKTDAELIRQAYLRTFSREPSAAELANAATYVKESTDQAAGMRDLVWALMNAKEFVVNH
ncbi:MAG: DUF1549 and DUF1553 domain-containing protein [Planctomycetia bacterium]|nr:DUF1549 and DUF1553 domain-containing protein [Planctomycetia bacterium]